MEVARTVLGVLLWPAGLGAAVASLLAHGGRFSARLDLLTHAAPFYLAAGAVTLALAALGPRPGRLALVVTAALAVAASVALMAPEVLARLRQPVVAAGASEQLKVIQFNAWGGNAKARAATDWLVAQEPDIIVTQEIGEIADLLVERGYRTGACRRCGVRIFARRPPLRTYAAPAMDSRGLSYMVAATYADARGEFTVVGVHRYWPSRLALTRRQSAHLADELAKLAVGRVILAGDFNSTPWSFARRREDEALGLVRRTRAVFTWPAERVSHNRLPALFPYLPIDHVYAGAGWATVAVERGPRMGSDHYPVIVTLAPANSARP